MRKIRSSSYDSPLRSNPDRKLVLAIMLFFFSAFLLVACRYTFDWKGFVLAAAVPVMIWLSTMTLSRFFRVDKLLLGITDFLCALGILILYTTDRSAGTSRGLSQAMNYGIGLIVMLICLIAVKNISGWKTLSRIMMAASAVFLAVPVAIGTEINGAANWIRIAGVSLQPSELVKIPLVIILAWNMSRRNFWEWLAFSVFSLLILMLQKDLGTALIYYITALFLFYSSTGNLPLTGVGLIGGAGAAVLGYILFSHVKKRVAIWKNPWLYYESSGYQIVQMLMAIASGGLFGTGLGLGSPRSIPIYYTDCIFAVICEQFGVIFGALVLLMYVLMILRGVYVAMNARSSFLALTAMGATVIIGVQTFIIIGGVLKLIPLTGVTMPFVSYGGTSMLSCMGLIGLIQGVAAVNRDDMDYDYQISHTIENQQEMPEE